VLDPKPKILLFVCRFFLPHGLLLLPRSAPAPTARPAPSRPPLRRPSVPELPVDGKITPNSLLLTSLLFALDEDDEEPRREDEEPPLFEDEEEPPREDEEEPPKFVCD